MKLYTKQERHFLKKAILSNVYPFTINPRSFCLSKLEVRQTDGQASVKCMPSLHGEHYFSPKKIEFARFRLSDYLAKDSDASLSVPVDRAEDSQALVNYMNEIYLSSVNVRVTTPEYDIFRGLQYNLYLESLQPFTLQDPEVGKEILIQADAGSYLFEGSLKILFV